METTAPPSAIVDLFAAAGVVGQDRAVAGLVAAAAHPVHAYLLVGPPGVGGDEAAVAFAAALLGGATDDDVRRRVLAGSHPDVLVYERAGAYLSVDDAREITKLAFRSPVERDRKVVICPEVHLVEKAAPALLKTIEEPPPSTVFVLLAESVTVDLVTIASRCVVVDLVPLSTEAIAGQLVAEGVDPEQAERTAGASGGRLDRARLLAGDPGFAARQDAWRSIPSRLDGTGATVAALVDEVLSLADGILGPLRDRHDAELAELDQLDKVTGRKTARKAVEDRHKRELRRARTDDLKAGMATLSAELRDRLVQRALDPSALRAITDAAEALVRNPNEQLLLSALLLRIDAAREPPSTAKGA